MTVLVVTASDTHANSTLGLCAGTVDLPDGGTYIPSPQQQDLWTCWLDFWKTIKKLKRKHRAKVWAVFVGDIIDMNVHSKGELISPYNATTAHEIAFDTLDPALKIVDKTFICRGTTAHVGGQGQLEEKLAKDIEAERDELLNTWSWYHLPLLADGVLFDIAHHPESGSNVEWTQGNAANRIAATIMLQYASSYDEFPQVVVRAHKHRRQISEKTHPVSVVCLPAWTLKSSFVYRIGKAAGLPDIGGAYFVCNDGKLIDWDLIDYKPKRRPPWSSDK